MIPITILTGFLGSGKTTLVNRIISQNPNIRVGLVVNEFGEVGIDGQLVIDSGQEMVELSNGCMCCIVRSDLYTTVENLINTGKVDYILIEASGLAEPKPIADTFLMNNLDERVSLDAIVCLVDVDNYKLSQENYKVAIEQIEFCDIIILNKVTAENEHQVEDLKKVISEVNPAAAILNSKNEFDSRILIERNHWPLERLLSYTPEKEDDHDHHEDGHHDHGHEHDEVDEVVFTTKPGAKFDPDKLDDWLRLRFPENVVRAKGIINLKKGDDSKYYVFQMVGAGKSLYPFEKTTDFSRMVLIGKELDKTKIINDLEACLV